MWPTTAAAAAKATDLLKIDIVEAREIAKEQRKRSRRQADFRSYAFQNKETLPVAPHRYLR